MILNISSLFLLALFLSSCSPLPVYRINSLDDNKSLLMGRETVFKRDKNLEIILNFERQSGNDLVFYLVVENNSFRPVTIDPSRIFAEVLDSVDKVNPKFFALDPEDQLIQIDKNINQIDANKETSDGINTIILTLDAVSSIAGLFQERSQEQIDAETNIRLETEQDIERTEIEYNNKINSLNESKKYWEDEVLRRTTLNTGQKTGGFFYLPVFMENGFFNLIIPVGSKQFKFHYKQIKY